MNFRLTSDRRRIIVAAVYAAVCALCAAFMPGMLDFGVDAWMLTLISIAISVICVLSLLFDTVMTSKPFGIIIKTFAAALCLMVLFIEAESLSSVSVTKLLGNNFGAFLVGYLLIAALYGVFYAFFRRVSIALKITTCLIALFAAVNYYLLLTRGSPLVPLDIAGAGTGLPLAKNYDLSITPRLARSLLTYAAIFLISPRLNYLRTDTQGFKLVRIGCFILSVGLIAFFTSSYTTPLTLDPSLFDQAASAQKNGSIVNFVSNLAHMKIDQPEGYSYRLAYSIASGYPSDSVSDAGVLPDIVLVLGESWADITGGVATTSEGVMPFMDSLGYDEFSARGKLVVSTIGGGTSVSELQVLALVSNLFGINADPLEYHVSEHLPSIVSQLGSLGYETTALHTGTRQSWSRDAAFPNLGFGHFYGGDELVSEGSPMLRFYPSDKLLYDGVLETLSGESAAPQFVYAITLQTHGGYSDEDFIGDVSIISPDGDYPRAEQYLSLMRRSDEDFESFISGLEGRSRPTIVLAFGDHQPGVEAEFSKAVSDGSDLSLYTTFYVLWANFELPVEVRSVPDTISINYLSTVLMQAASLPLTGYEKLLINARQILPIASTGMTVTSDGLVKTGEDMKNSATYRYLSVLQYNLLFDREHYPVNFYELSK